MIVIDVFEFVKCATQVLSVISFHVCICWWPGWRARCGGERMMMRVVLGGSQHWSGELSSGRMQRTQDTTRHNIFHRQYASNSFQRVLYQDHDL